MTEQRHDDLERALAELGQHIDFPPAPALARAVRQRIAAAPPPRAPFWLGLLQRRRRWLTAALALTAIIALALGLSRGARTTIADRLGLGGADVQLVSSPVVPATNPAGAQLDLGQRITLEQAATTLGFRPIAPPLALYGAPDEVWIKQLPAGKQVTYLYRPRAGLPVSASSGVGLLVSQFAGDTNASFIQKQLGDGAHLDLVAVRGASAFWISGAPHVFYYKDSAGQIQQETLRLAGNTLIWEHDGFTLRIESALTEEQAIAVAESITPGP